MATKDSKHDHHEHKDEPKAAPHKDEGLVLMVKDGEETFVHPTCVKAHQTAGWVLPD